ncbi:NADPH-dependent 1-acyldihydroxyacetone phosphate reductase [Vanrija pseudolonga]|uniref:NADPH-dependent 1-acyldihydroxyacetone phosphate reductase n=1 Tax=Vanrija pseudolonga TaxID=143232 RepID=A0AAF1BKN7_9TREE|nr:NADPH-dependent 1-acyldihydroxyacetone phosphate reductase [Vanrija pseudolonga]
MPATPPRVALITGCSEPTSLGAHLALELKRRGFRVFASARKLSTMDALKAEGLDTIELDVVSADSIVAALAHITAEAGRLDVLVNNAGISGLAPLLDTDIARMKALYDVNVFGPLAMVQAFAGLLSAGAKEAGRDSVVINVGSGSVNGFPCLGAYGSFKAALQIMSDVLRREVKSLHIRVITLELYGVQTAMADGHKTFDITRATLSGFYDTPTVKEKANTLFSERMANNPTSPQVAKQLADAILASSPPLKMWAGGEALPGRFVMPALPVWVMDSIVARMFAKIL